MARSSTRTTITPNSATATSVRGSNRRGAQPMALDSRTTAEKKKSPRRNSGIAVRLLARTLWNIASGASETDADDSAAR